MDNKSSELVDELESGNFLTEIIESNQEMNNLLLESDFALQTAETELKATIIENSISSDEESSQALSIEVSEDLFKGHLSDINFSPIRYKSDIKQPVLSNNINNLLEEFNSDLKNFNETFKVNLDTSVQNNSNVSNDELNIKKTVTMKSSLINSDEEHDYIYVDMYKTLEITVPNTKENTSGLENKTATIHQDHFKGCSVNFDSTITNDYTIIINNDVNLSENKYADNETSNCSSDTLKIETDVLSQDNHNNKEINNKSKVEISECINDFPQIDKSELLLNNNIEISNPKIEVTVYNNQAESDVQETQNTANNMTEKITINENNNIIPQSLKRHLEDTTSIENHKNIKLDEDIIIIDDSSSHSNDNNEPTSLNFDFTQAIFDPQETADHNDPKWSILKELETTENYFQSVRTQWCSLSLPNPHKSNTIRYVPENIIKIKSETVTSADDNQAMSVNEYFDKKIVNINQEINVISSKLNNSLRYKSTKERNKLQQQIDDLKHIRHEIEKNQEEIKHINMFYYNESQGWNANYLTRSELCEIQEQDKILEFQKKFYKS